MVDSGYHSKHTEIDYIAENRHIRFFLDGSGVTLQVRKSYSVPLQVRFLFVVVVVEIYNYYYLLPTAYCRESPGITNFRSGPRWATRQNGAICLKITNEPGVNHE